MSRHLAVSLEPSDAFLALLRLKAASEVGRWPAQLSGRFRASLEREFASLESAVRTLGVCYADLEERGIATVDRTAHSRFGDIDSAIHLGACPIGVSVDLDHLKVALERGDRGTRASMASKNAGTRSMMMALRPQRCAATAVVPLPPKGSSTVSPGLDQDNMWSSAISTGNGAGCPSLFPPWTGA